MGATTPGQSRPKTNGNEGVFHTSQNSRTGVSPSNAVYCHTQFTPFGGILPLHKSYNQHILRPANKTKLFSGSFYDLY